MKTEFKAKYLQHLVKKNQDKGFTLIELLVVIIIVGVLAAIALPSFLNQIGKARGSEGKSNMGTINRAQQAYRLEQNTFASNLTNLDAKISGKFYSYVLATGATAATGGATTTFVGQTDLKGYSGGVAQTGDFFGQVICESTAIGASPGVGTAPILTGTSGTCPSNSKVVE
jgi:prepilin-type N-terminal cleavage/methylation domain-containing protein